jgi:hypothetical protein
VSPLPLCIPTHELAVVQRQGIDFTETALYDGSSHYKFNHR